MSVVAGLCTLTCLSIFLTFVIYMAIFAFSNPDSDAYYQAYTGTVSGADVEFQGLSADLLSFPANMPFTTTDLTLDVTPIHAIFCTWFMWGFLNTVLFCTFCCGAILIARCAQSLVGCCFCLMACTQCSGSVWYIMGLVWRLNKAGRFASGDIVPYGVADQAAWDALKADTPAEDHLFQLQSGNFMWVYFVISWVLMGTSCVCGCVLPCLAACFK
jgi:hypothetical protein